MMSLSHVIGGLGSYCSGNENQRLESSFFVSYMIENDIFTSFFHLL